MSKKPHPHQNGNGPGIPPRDEEVVELPPGVTLLTIPFAERPVRMAANGKLRLNTPADPSQPMLLVLDAEAGVWKAVVLPPNVTWILQPDAAPKAALWQPGQPR